MALKIQSGHPVTDDVQDVEGQFVRFMTEDGRAMFEVHAGKDGRSIEVRAIQATKVDGVIYDTILNICPKSSNAVDIFTQRYTG